MAEGQRGAGAVAECGGAVGLPPCLAAQGRRSPAGPAAGQPQARYNPLPSCCYAAAAAAAAAAMMPDPDTAVAAVCDAMCLLLPFCCC